MEPKYVATRRAAVFTEILSLLYTYTYYDEPEYNKIIFLYEKILLDLNVTPSLKNMDWIKRDFENQILQSTISDESFEKKDLNEENEI